MPDTLVIRGGTVVDSGGERRSDVRIVEGVIAEIGADVDVGDDAQVLDATDCLVTAGLVDLNAHVRQPGDEETETVASAGRAAVLGGYTAIVAMPDTDPVVDTAAAVQELRALAREAPCDVEIAGAITMGCNGSHLAPMAEMHELGVSLFSDGARSIDDEGVLRRAMEYAGDLGVTLCLQSERASLASGGHMHEGAVSSRLGIPGIPAQAEEIMVMEVIALVQMTGTRVHFQQLSTGASLTMVGAARTQALPVTCDVSPHHLGLTDSLVESFDAVYKLAPPLRTADDAAQLRRALSTGAIDAIATGHAPHGAHLKEAPFDQAPAGAVGLQTAFAVAVTDAGVAPTELFAALSWRPAAIAGIEHRHGGHLRVGRPANLAVFDPTMEWTVDAGAGASRSRNCPHHGRTLRGGCRHTVVDGIAVVVHGELTR